MKRKYLTLILITLIIGISLSIFSSCTKTEEKNNTSEAAEDFRKSVEESRQKRGDEQDENSNEQDEDRNNESYSIAQAKEMDNKTEAILNKDGMVTFPDKITDPYCAANAGAAPLDDIFLLKNDTISSVTKFNIQTDQLITFTEKPQFIYKVINTFKTVPLFIRDGSIFPLSDSNIKFQSVSTVQTVLQSKDIENINDIPAEEFFNQYLDKNTGLLNLDNYDRSEIVINYYAGTDYYTENINVNEYTCFVYNDKESVVSGVEKTHEGYFIVNTTGLESGVFYYINSGYKDENAVFQAQ